MTPRFGSINACAAQALAVVAALGLLWCVDCGGTAADSRAGFGGGAGAPGTDETKIAVRRGGQLSLVEFSEPTRPRTTVLTDHVWPMRATRGNLGSTGVAWSPSGAWLAWANDDGTAGALVDGRVVQAPLEPESVSPGVHFLDEETVAVHPLSVLRMWEPRADVFRTRVSADVWEMAGGGYVYCQENRAHFVSKSGQSATWDRSFPFFLDEKGEHVALVVPEAGASLLESPLVGEIVVPEASTEPLDCRNPPVRDPLLVFGRVQWSASGDRFGALLSGSLRVGGSPLDEEDLDVAHYFAGSSFRRSWYFDGEEVHFVERGSDADVEPWTLLNVLSSDGTVSTLGESDGGELLVDSVDRAEGRGTLLVTDFSGAYERAIYLLNSAAQLERLVETTSTHDDLPVLRPRPDGPGVAIFTATECPWDQPCIDPETLVWPDPDTEPETFFTLTGDAHWVPGTAGLVLVSAGEVFFVRQDEPERLHRLAAGEEILVPALVPP